VELGTASLWGGAVILHGPGVAALRAAVFFSLLLAIALGDARFYRIPNPLSLGGAGVGLLSQFLPEGMGFIASLIGAGSGVVILQSVRWVASQTFGREAMGGGDVRMMALLGAFLGWELALASLFVAALLGVLFFIPVAWQPGRMVPFGVFLALAGALLWVLREGDLVHAFLSIGLS